MVKEITKLAPKRFTMECERCETQFMYSLSDCKRRGYNYYIRCPWCNNDISHIKRIREIPKSDIQEEKMFLLKDFADAIKKQFPVNAEMYLGYKIKDVVNRKTREFVREIKNDEK